ncbi:MAG: flagellar motor switch protein FliG [Deltaproteobacteria bacterium]|nr:flagellar motor switch protein FliG [Deltaproteobacteria bacterium]
MAEEQLTGPQKAAIFLLTMGEDFTANIFRQLEDGEIKHLGRAMSRIQNINPTMIQEVLGSFYDELTSPSELRVKGDDFFKSSITRAVTDERAEGLLQDLNSDVGPAPFESLRDVDSKVLGNFIRNEHPQTIALILAHLESGKAAEILASFPEQLQVDVVYRIADLDRVPHQMIVEVEQVLKEEIAALGSVGSRELGGAKTVAEILNQVDQNTENAILTKLEEDKVELANEIRKLMFVFEDLIGIDDRGIRSILKEVNNEELTMSLKTASEELKKKILSNLSERAADMIREDLEVMGPVKLGDVEKAQQSVLRVAKKLESEGKIAIGKGGGEDVFV